MEERAARSPEYDVIVVGSGPAGISAAINVANRKRTVAVLDGQPPLARPRKANSIPDYPGFTFTSGEELAAAFTRHLEEFEVPLIAKKVSKIVEDEGGFVVFSERAVYHAAAVVLAAGLYREAEIEGEEELVGQGVSYCVTCDGRLFAGRRAAFISYAPEGEEEAAALAQDYAVEVTYLPLYEGDYRLPKGVCVLSGRRPAGLARVESQMRVSLPSEELAVDAVFIYKHTVSPRTLLAGLVSNSRHLTVGRQMETAIPGVFAAGDCTGEPYQIAKAVGEGQVAALHAVRFLRRRAQIASRDTA